MGETARPFRQLFYRVMGGRVVEHDLRTFAWQVDTQYVIEVRKIGCLRLFLRLSVQRRKNGYFLAADKAARCCFAC